MTIKQVLTEANFKTDKIYVSLSTLSSISNDFEISPEEYIRFATQDLKSLLPHSSINAITNAKRAVDCMIDNVRSHFDLQKINKDVHGFINANLPQIYRGDFPIVLKIVMFLDLAPINLVDKLRKMRHLVEHEYQMPTRKKAAEAVELADLFINAVQNKVRYYDDHITLDNSPPRRRLQRSSIGVHYDDNRKSMVVDRYDIESRTTKASHVKSDHPEFLLLLKCMLSIKDSDKSKENLKAFFQAAGLKKSKRKLQLSYS